MSWTTVEQNSVEAAKESPEGFRLGVQYLYLAGCFVFFAAYVALIVLLKTETARRTSAPPWYCWIKLPAATNLWEMLWLLPPVGIYAGWVFLVRGMMRRMPGDGMILAVAAVFVLGMNATMAMVDGGPGAIWAPFNLQGHEYYFDVARVHGVGSFLRDYVVMLPSYSIHTATHPPGAVLFLYGVAKLLGPRLPAAAWGAVVVTASGVIPAMLLVRRIYGREIALIFLGLYVVTPNLVLFGATSMDGVFLTALLWSLYFLYRTVDGGSGAWAVAAGVCLAAATMLTFATVCLGVLMAVYVLLRGIAMPREIKRMAAALAICAVVFAGCFILLDGISGFNVLDCLAACRHSDHYVMKTFRLAVGRYFDISFNNLLAFCLGAGLVSIMLWGRYIWREIRTIGRAMPPPQPSPGVPGEGGRGGRDLLQIALAGTLLILSFCGLFTRETERIWIFFSPVILMGAARMIRSIAGENESHQARLTEWAMGGLFLQTWVIQIFLYTMW